MPTSGMKIKANFLAEEKIREQTQEHLQGRSVDILKNDIARLPEREIWVSGRKLDLYQEPAPTRTINTFEELTTTENYQQLTDTFEGLHNVDTDNESWKNFILGFSQDGYAHITERLVKYALSQRFSGNIAPIYKSTSQQQIDDIIEINMIPVLVSTRHDIHYDRETKTFRVQEHVNLINPKTQKSHLELTSHYKIDQAGVEYESTTGVIKSSFGGKVMSTDVTDEQFNSSKMKSLVLYIVNRIRTFFGWKCEDEEERGVTFSSQSNTEEQHTVNEDSEPNQQRDTNTRIHGNGYKFFTTPSSTHHSEPESTDKFNPTPS